MKKALKLPLLMLLISPSLHAAPAVNSETARRQSLIMSGMDKYVNFSSALNLSKLGDSSTGSQINIQKILNSSSSDKCLIDTCGNPNTNWNAYNMTEPRQIESVSFAQMWENEIVPLISKNLSAEYEFNQELTKQVTEKLPTAKLKEEQKKALASFLIFKNSASDLASVANALLKVDLSTFSIQLDETALAALTDSLPADTALAIQVILKRYIAPLLVRTFRVNFESPLIARLRVGYPGVDEKQALVQDAKSLLKSYESMGEHYGAQAAAYMINMTDSEKELLKAAAAGKVIEAVEANNYAAIAANIDFYSTPLEGDIYDLFSKMDTSLDAAFTAAQKSYPGALQQVVQAFDLKGSITSNEETCRPKLGLRTSADASEFKRVRALKMISEIRDAAKTVIKKFVVEGEGQSEVSKQIDRAQFNFPDSNDLFLEKYKATLIAHTEFLRSQLRFLQSGSDEVTDFLLVTGVLRAQTLASSSSIFDEKPKAECDKIDVSTFTDFSVPPFGVISVSWATLAYPEYSLGAMAHELGHVVSNKIRKLENVTDAANFYESLSCVANRNPFLEKKMQLSKFQNSEWSEEDWADHFAALVITEMENRKSQWTDSTKNVACAMVMNDEHNYTLNSMEPTPNDPHSAALLRLFMIGTDSGNLAPSCQAVLKPDTCK